MQCTRRASATHQCIAWVYLSVCVYAGSRAYDGGFATLEAPMAESKEYYLITGLSIDNFLTYFAQHGQGKDPVGALAK